LPVCRIFAGERREISRSEKKGKPHAIKLMKLAEAWAREAQDELEMGAEDIEPVVQAMRDALDRQIGRKAGKR
jgi:hypothetical protein